MPQTVTAQLGTLDYLEESVLTFPMGLPGFENRRRFVLIKQPALAPLIHLQSLETPELCFLAMPVHAIDSTYRVVLVPEDESLLGIEDEAAPPLVLAILAASGDGTLTANLMAPVVVNINTRVAVQAVRPDNSYSHQHALASSCL